jgi:protein-S-isoprenylcysteine O-methyltransferase Ste14
MEKGNTQINNAHHRHAIHSTLAHSYYFHLVTLLLGVILDIFFPVKIFSVSFMAPIGFFMLFIATVIIVWAQFSYRNLEGKEVTKEHFFHGAYCYTRNPTHWGIFIMILGFGFIMNAFFIIILSLISIILTKLVFLKKHESVMQYIFGAPYQEYKKSVKL